jgi:hypothetical protein
MSEFNPEPRSLLLAAQKNQPGAQAPHENPRRPCILHLPLHLSFGHCHALKQGRKAGHFMKTKLLAMMLLAGGSMFAQTRFSVGIGVGGHGAGFYQPSPYRQSFNDGDGDDRQVFTRGSNEQYGNRGFDQARGFNQSQTRDFGRTQSQNQNRWNNNRSDDQDDHQKNGYAHGFRGR